MKGWGEKKRKGNAKAAKRKDQNWKKGEKRHWDQNTEGKETSHEEIKTTSKAAKDQTSCAVHRTTKYATHSLQLLLLWKPNIVWYDKMCTTQWYFTQILHKFDDRRECLHILKM